MRSAAPSSKLRAPTGSARSSRTPKKSISPPPRRASRRSTPASGTRSASCTAACVPPSATKPCAGSPAARSSYWSPPPWSRWGSTCPRPRSWWSSRPSASGSRSFINCAAALRDTDDGFKIAEEDLALRGEGEVLGVRQSGLPEFRIARPELHRDLLEAARKDAALIVARDAALTSERGKALRLVLRLFEREEAVRLIEAG